MSGSIPIVQEHAHIKRERVAGVTKFRWYCSCVRPNTFPAQPRSGQWHRKILTVIESFRQHWDAVHKEHEPPDWDFMMNRVVVWAVGDISEDDAAGFWVAPSGKRPAVAEDYTLIVRLDTDGRSVSGTAEYWATPEEEKKGMSRLSDIEARLRELEKEAARYARFPKTDEWPVGTVVVYDFVHYSGAAGEQEFTYAVFKCANEKWYWTGHGLQTRSGGSYDTLIEHLADDGVSNIRVATPEDFDLLFPALEDLVGLEDTKTVEEVSENLADKGIYVPVVKRADG